MVRSRECGERGSVKRFLVEKCVLLRSRSLPTQRKRQCWCCILLKPKEGTLWDQKAWKLFPIVVKHRGLH